MTNTTKTLEELQKDSRDDIVAHAYKTGFIAALDACREKMPVELLIHPHEDNYTEAVKEGWNEYREEALSAIYSLKDPQTDEDIRGGMCSQCGTWKGGDYGINGDGVQSRHTCSLKDPQG